jgi:excisionase family DNA binding protein
MTRKLLTTKEAANHLGVSIAYLERDRWAGARVPFVRLGKRSIRYRQEDLDTFVTARIHHSTSSYQMPQAMGA